VQVLDSYHCLEKELLDLLQRQFPLSVDVVEEIAVTGMFQHHEH
jgi:hypothetical protein